MFWRLFGMLASVAAILALAWASSRWIARRGGAGGWNAPGAGSAFAGLSGGFGTFGTVPPGGSFRLLAQIALGRGERLVLVRLQEACYLLGVTEHQITLLKELDAEASAVWLAQPDPAPPPVFLDVLKETLEKRRRNTDKEDKAE